MEVNGLKFIQSVNKFMVHVWRAYPSSAEMQYSKSINIDRQQENWIAHCVRADDDSYIKQLTFPDYYQGEAKKPGILNNTNRQVLLRFKKANCKCTSAKCKCNADEMITRFRDRNPRGVTTHAHNSEVQM